MVIAERQTHLLTALLGIAEGTQAQLQLSVQAELRQEWLLQMVVVGVAVVVLLVALVGGGVVLLLLRGDKRSTPGPSSTTDARVLR